MSLVAFEAFKMAELPDDLVMRPRGWTAARDQAKIRHGLCRRRVAK